jgi:hypothetical protein
MSMIVKDGDIQVCADMKIIELKELIADLPDNMEVVVSGEDHAYLKTGNRSGVVKAESYNKNVKLWEYHGDENKCCPSNKVVEVFWIDDGKY